jgi:helicase MOV-10
MSKSYAKAKGVAVKIRNPHTGEDVLTKIADVHKGNEMELNSSLLPRAPVPRTNPERRHGSTAMSRPSSQTRDGILLLPANPPPSQIPPSLPISQPQPISQLTAPQSSKPTSAPPQGNPSASPNPPPTTGWIPDVYARPHIPLWLQQINESNGQQMFSRSMSTLDFEAYVSTFAGRVFMPPAAPPLPTGARVDRLSLSLTTRNLIATNFYAYFEECLIAERQSNVQDLKSFNCYQRPLNAYDPSNCLFWVHVPGLRENAPSVVLNDIVLVRQLSLGPDNETAHAMHVWARQGGGKERGQFAPGFNGIINHAVVHGIDRAQERLFLRIDYAGPGVTCNIEFIVQANHYLPILRSVTNVSNTFLKSEARVRSHRPESSFGQRAIVDQLWEGMESGRDCQWLRRMLFPEQSDAIKQTTLAQGVYGLDWVDTMLNYEQQKAVGSVVSRNYGILPYLISGPPGTGKTKTIVESTMQLLNLYKVNGPHILVCAPSDPAADTLALRLSKHLNPRELFRLNAPQRTFAEVSDQLMPYCYTESELFSLPPFKQLMKYMVVVTTCRGADILVQARVTNRDLISLGQGMTSVLTGGHLPHHDFMHWKALLMDEAAQATEPEACIPLTVVDVDVSMPDNLSDTLHTPLFVMAGDYYQLGPRVFNRDTALSVSLFERLFSRPLYIEHPASRRNMTRSASPSAPQPTYPAFTNLIRNYRSHPAILAIPSSLFYHDTLIPEAPRSDSLATLPLWSGRRWPLLFSCNSGPDDIEQDAGGWFNKSEALLALSHTKTILSHSTLTPSEICIMSPFGAQVSHLRTLFRANDLRDVNIGPLEAFQGLESPVVILCTTRTRARFLGEDRQRGLGIVFEAKQFNVAITRAKLGLFVIGNPGLLAADPTWRVFLEFCWRNGLWSDEDGSSDWRPAGDVVEGMPSRVSSMEAALVFEQRDKGVEGGTGGARFLRGSLDEEEGMWAAGIAAENVLRDEGNSQL